MIEAANSSPLDTNDERRRGSIRAFAKKLLVVGGNDDTNDKRAKSVKDSQTVDESASRFRNIATRRDSLTSTERDELWRSDEGETSADKGCPECQKIARAAFGEIGFERSRILPVPEAETPLTVRTTSKHDGETDDNQAHNCDELDGSEPELSFTENTDSDDVKEQDNDEEDSDPYSGMDRSLPIVQENGSSSGFGSHKDGICVPVVPASSESQ